MKKAGLFVMVISAITLIAFTVLFFHGTTDNVVDSDGFWAYMYGAMSVPWALYSAGVVFFMGLTVFFATMEQTSQRY